MPDTAAQRNGGDVKTIEGVAEGVRLHPLPGVGRFPLITERYLTVT